MINVKWSDNLELLANGFFDEWRRERSVFRKTCVVNFVSGAVFAVFVGSVAHADSKPAWAEQAPDGTFWSWVNAYGVTDYATTDYTAQYLLNVAAAKTPAALSIDGIEVGSFYEVSYGFNALFG